MEQLEEQKYETKEEVKNEEKVVEGKSLKNQKTRKKKKIMIFGFPIIRLLAYFVIYSVIGFVIETLFGLVTKGVIESRKSFLYGPFCAIYGVGAVVMIIGLQKFKKNNYTLFWGGFLIGSLVEYVISWIGEIVFHAKWWDYSDIPFNLNGRILDWCVSSFALKMFLTRLVNNYNLELQEISTVQQEKYTKLYENEKIKPIIDTFFSDEIMLKTFPNLKVTSKDGEIIWICDILKDIQPYYFRVFTPSAKK